MEVPSGQNSGLTAYFSVARKINEIVDSVAEREIDTILITIRNDLITGNLSQARIDFARSSSRSSIVALEVKDASGIVLSFPEVLTPRPKDLKLFVKEVRFSPGGEVWGQASFFVDQRRAREIKDEMAIRNFVLGIVLFIVLLASVLTLLTFFQFVSGVLIQIFGQALAGKDPTWRESIPISNPISIWQKVIDKAYHIGKEFRESRDNLERMRERAVVAQTIAQVAHDLRSPLGAIGIATRKLTGGQGALFEVTNAAIERSNLILDEALEKWKKSAPLTTKDTSVGVERADLRLAINSAIQEANFRLTNLQVCARTDNLNVTVPVSSVILNRVFTNLLTNSAQSEKERITVKIGIRQDSESVSIEFTDDGPGFSLQALRNATSGNYTEKPEGTGLGLNFCRTSIERYGGLLAICNATNGGASVTIVLPIAK